MSLPCFVYDSVHRVRQVSLSCVVGGRWVVLDTRIEIEANWYYLEYVEDVPHYVRSDQSGNVIDSKAVEIAETGPAYITLADGSRLAVDLSVALSDSDSDSDSGLE